MKLDRPVQHNVMQQQQQHTGSTAERGVQNQLPTTKASIMCSARVGETSSRGQCLVGGESGRTHDGERRKNYQKSIFKADCPLPLEGGC
ncbi:hypothetical protein CEXT_119171 [Caerostris extrusa]|uniref:Uncharacterized protein n=1 Tax=Caerostris extrusa TaxID=172846 RepID=A0AAV4TJW3_CAEEX|nr:hypothetical protein CEXT_119171 [Caerostris extrusa]